MKHITQLLAASGILLISASGLSAATASQINRSQSRTHAVQSEAQSSSPRSEYKTSVVKRTPFEINRAQSSTRSVQARSEKQVIVRSVDSALKRTPSEINRLRSNGS